MQAASGIRRAPVAARAAAAHAIADARRANQLNVLGELALVAPQSVNGRAGPEFYEARAVH